MKGKRYTTEDKIRILREADGGKAILEAHRERNIPEVSFCPPSVKCGRTEPGIHANRRQSGTN
jgi:hypothetical protein